MLQLILIKKKNPITKFSFLKFKNYKVTKYLTKKSTRIFSISSKGHKLSRSKKSYRDYNIYKIDLIKNDKNLFNCNKMKLIKTLLSLVISIKHYNLTKLNWVLLKSSSSKYYFWPQIEGIIPGNYITFFNNLYTGSLTSFLFKPKKFKYISFIKFKYTKSTGTFSLCLLLNKEKNIVKCKLSSGVVRVFKFNELFLIGRVSNRGKKYLIKKKNSYLGKIKKSIVRGVAMNPVDHPHGGRTKTNKPEVSKWGWVAKHSH